MAMTEDDARDQIKAIFNGRISQVKLDAIVELMREAEAFDRFSYVVEIPSAKVPVETVEAYGLLIRVDANGRAQRIETIDGEAMEGVE